MVLREVRVIDAATVPATARVTATTLAASQAIDGEACRVGLFRRARRVVLQNLDNNIVVVHFATQDDVGGNDAILPKAIELTNYAVFIYEPEKNKEAVMRFLSTPTVRRFSAYLRNGDDTGAPAGLVNGVRVNTDYLDDLEA